MDVSSIKLNGTAYEVKDAQAREAIDNIKAILMAAQALAKKEEGK